MLGSKDNGDVETYFKKRPRRNNLNTAIEMSNKLQERMYQEKLFVDTPVLDETGQIRMDDWELREDVQSEIKAFWDKLYAHEIPDFSYIDEYWVAFRQLFGFDLPNVDYSKDVDPNVAIPSIQD